MPLTDNEAKMEMVLPLLVTDTMQLLESQGKHPEADFTARLRTAILKVIPGHPDIENDIWDQDKKQQIVEKLCDMIEL